MDYSFKGTFIQCIVHNSNVHLQFQKQVNLKCLALTRFYSSDVCIKVERFHNVKIYSILCQNWVQSAPNKVHNTPSPECSNGSGVSVSSLDELNRTLQSRTPYQCVNTLHTQEKNLSLSRLFTAQAHLQTERPRLPRKLR